jgi:hypothetical protein
MVRVEERACLNTEGTEKKRDGLVRYSTGRDTEDGEA